MGIRICDILKNDYFHEFQVIAGHGGLEKRALKALLPMRYSREAVRDIHRFSTQLEMEIPAGQFRYSFYEEPVQILEVKRCVERCEKAMELMLHLLQY